jgi:hydroxyacylglutathione hydrolase
MRAWPTSSGVQARRVIGGRSNIYLIRGPEASALVDTSTRANLSRLLKALDGLGIARLDYLFLTHLHFDHVDNAEEVRGRFGARIVLQKAAADYLARGLNEPIDGSNRFTKFAYASIGGDETLRASKFTACRPFVPDIILGGEADLEAFGLPGRIVPTPGHSPGSMSLVLEDEVAIAGDTLFHVFPGSVMPPWAQDADAMIRSWGKLLESKSKVFLPGHGRPITRSLLESCYLRARAARQ